MRAKSFILSGSLSEGGTSRPEAIFTCVMCSTQLRIALKVGESLNPEAFASTARNRGWSAKPYSAGSVLCPYCTANRPTNNVDSELEKFAQKQEVKPPMATVAQHIASNQILSLPPASRAIAEREALPKPPTADQRLKIRSLLDANFDDAKGRYLDGYSDDKIAQAASVARKVVEIIREAAYGPLRASPEVQAVEKDIAVLEERIVDLRAKLQEMQATVNKTSSDLQAIISRTDNDLADLKGRVAKIRT